MRSPTLLAVISVLFLFYAISSAQISVHWAEQVVYKGDTCNETNPVISWYSFGVGVCFNDTNATSIMVSQSNTTSTVQQVYYNNVSCPDDQVNRTKSFSLNQCNVSTTDNSSISVATYISPSLSIPPNLNTTAQVFVWVQSCSNDTTLQYRAVRISSPECFASTSESSLASFLRQCNDTHIFTNVWNNNTECQGEFSQQDVHELGCVDGLDIQCIKFNATSPTPAPNGTSTSTGDLTSTGHTTTTSEAPVIRVVGEVMVVLLLATALVLAIF